MSKIITGGVSVTSVTVESTLIPISMPTNGEPSGKKLLAIEEETVHDNQIILPVKILCPAFPVALPDAFWPPLMQV
ncbi:MAG: hypothetical protein ACLQJ7_19330 [Syntrophobacteraceae bacterium]